MLSFPDFKYKQLIVHFSDGKKERLRFCNDNIIIENAEGKILLQHSCHRLFVLFIIGEISLTSVIIQKSSEFGFPIILMKNNLRVIARINTSAEGNTLLREKQYSAKTKKLEIAKALIRQKIDNQISLLSALRSKSVADKTAINELQMIRLDDATDTYSLMGMEGVASRIFFAAYFRPLSWVRREPRCKRDPANLLLDIGYTYLFNFIDAMLSLYGFDLYCGVHHTFFYHRKSLVCDIVEPFRCIIDQRIRKAHTLGQINEADFEFYKDHFQLPWKNQRKYTKLFLKDILERKEEIFKFCQAYYRWFVREKDMGKFPKFNI